MHGNKSENEKAGAPARTPECLGRLHAPEMAVSTKETFTKYREGYRRKSNQPPVLNRKERLEKGGGR